MSNATVIQPARGSLAQQLMLTVPPRQPERARSARARSDSPLAEPVVAGARRSTGVEERAQAGVRDDVRGGRTVSVVPVDPPAGAGMQCLAAAIESVRGAAKVEFCASWQAANALDAAHLPDLVVVDLDAAGYGDFRPLVDWRDGYPGVPLVVVSAQCERGVVTAALAAGASGYLPLGDDQAITESALRLVLAGGRYLPPEWMGYVRKPVPTAVRRASEPVAESAQPAGRGHPLTGRQLDVLRCLVEGKSNKEIARGLGLGVGTVKCHLQAIYRALNVENRTRAVVVARRVLDEGL
jgi:DNA-binding NarL/FixJ family response regulator